MATVMQRHSSHILMTAHHPSLQPTLMSECTRLAHLLRYTLTNFVFALALKPCVFQVWSLTPNADGSATVMLNGHRRLERTGVVHSSPLLKVAVRHLRDHKYQAEDDEVKASHLQLMTSLKVMLL